MKKIFLFLALVAVALSAEAQNELKFGKVTKADLQKTDYPIAAGADVVVLDECIQDGFSFPPMGNKADIHMQRVISRKVKILSPNTNFTLEIPFERNNLGEISIYDFYAYHYSLQNDKVSKQKFDNNNVIVENIDNSRGIAKFEWPDAKVGDIIEYRCVVFYYRLGQNIDYAIDNTNPILNSTYEAIVYKGNDIAINSFAYGDIPLKQAKIKDSRIEYPDVLDDSSMYSYCVNPSNNIMRFQDAIGNKYKKSSVIYSYNAIDIPANTKPAGVRVILPNDGVEDIRKTSDK